MTATAMREPAAAGLDDFCDKPAAYTDLRRADRRQVDPPQDRVEGDDEPALLHAHARQIARRPGQRQGEVEVMR